MEQFFVGIDKYLIHSYLLVLLANVLIFKRLNRHLLITLVLAAFDVFSDLIENPLYNFILTLGVHEGRAVWYFSWVLINLLAIKFIDFSMARLNLGKDSIVNAIKLSFVAFAIIHFASYVMRYVNDNEAIDFAVLTIKFSVQISVICILANGLRYRSKAGHKESPHAAHNRSIKWYQDLSKLPPAERVKELEKWSEFTSELPTSDTFRR